MGSKLKRTLPLSLAIIFVNKLFPEREGATKRRERGMRGGEREEWIIEWAPRGRIHKFITACNTPNKLAFNLKKREGKLISRKKEDIKRKKD